MTNGPADFEATLPAAGLAFVLAACDFGSERPALNAVRLAAFEGHLRLEGTNTFRVHRLDTTSAPPPWELLVPCELLEAALRDDVESVTLMVTGSAARVTAGGRQIERPLVAEPFPDLTGLPRVTPVGSVPLRALAEALAQGGGRHRDVVRLTCSGDDLLLAFGEGEAPAERAFGAVTPIPVDRSDTGGAGQTVLVIDVDRQFLDEAVTLAAAAAPGGVAILSLGDRQVAVSAAGPSGSVVTAMVAPLRSP